MNRRRLGLVAAIALSLGAVALYWTTCRGGARTSRTAAIAGDAGSANGAGRRASTRIDVATVARGSLEGTVVDPAGAPVAGARVCGYAYSDDLPDDETRDPFCTTAGADGRYRLAELLPAFYALHAHAARFVPGLYRTKTADGRDEWGVKLLAGEAKQGLDIGLGGDGVEVIGVVKDIGGGPVAGAWVYVNEGGRGGQRRGVATVQSETDGSFRAWAAPGRIRLTAEADGYANGEKEAIAPGQTVEILLTPESVLVGRVIEKQGGAPVAGARVQIQGSWDESEGTRWASAMSGEDGGFRISRLSPGRYKPTATAPGRRGQATESVLLGLGQTVDGIVIEVHAASVVTGKVVLADDKTPCPEGWVQLKEAKAGGYGDSASIEDDGAVELEAVLPGTYDVDVTCTGYRAVDDDAEVVVVAGTDPPEQLWKVGAGATLRGVALTHDDQPVAGVDVNAKPVVAADAWSSWEYATTEDDGTFEIEGMEAGPYNVTASGGGQPPIDKPILVDVPDQGEARVELRFGQGGALVGVVRDEDGAPVARVHVRASGKGWSWNDNDSTQTLDDGTFRLDGLAPGPRRVTASRGQWGGTALRAPGKNDDDQQGEKVEVRAGQTARVELVVESQSGVIKGRVVDAGGAAITDAFVDAERETDSAAAGQGGTQRSMRWAWSRRPSLTDTDGGFTIEQLSRGTYTVRAYRRGGGEALVEHVALGGSVTVTIRDPGSIAGLVAIEGGGAPDKMRVTVTAAKSGFSRHEDFFRTDGAFVMRDLPAGQYDVAVTSAQGTGDAEVTLADGQHVRDVAIVMKARAGVTGRLVTADEGKPLAGYMISVMPSGSKGQMQFGMDGPPPMSDADGKFEVPNAPAGKVEVMAYPLDMQGTLYAFGRAVVTLEGGTTTDIGEIKIEKMRAPVDEDPGDLGFELKEGDAGADPDELPLTVAIVRPDGPAAKAGLKVGDVIIAVDGHDVRGDVYAYWQRVFVPPGTTITLGLERGATVTITAGEPRS